jgi:hypothetical protein
MNSKPSEMLDRIADKLIEQSDATIERARRAKDSGDSTTSLSFHISAHTMILMANIFCASASEERAKEAALAKREESAP